MRVLYAQSYDYTITLIRKITLRVLYAQSYDYTITLIRRGKNQYLFWKLYDQFFVKHSVIINKEELFYANISEKFALYFFRKKIKSSSMYFHFFRFSLLFYLKKCKPLNSMTHWERISWNWPSGSGKTFESSSNCICYFAIIFTWEKSWLFNLTNLISSVHPVVLQR